MKCPKCGYLGFERVDRCRNCGYEFSLSAPLDLPELPIRAESSAVAPADDLPLLGAGAKPQPPDATSLAALDVDAAPPVVSTSDDLSLFGSAILDDGPLITRPSPPRPPLAVRRATPEAPRLRAESPRTPMLDLGPADTDWPTTPPASAVAPQEAHGRAFPSAPLTVESAGWIARSLALLIDLAILAAIDAVVVYFTIQVCGLGFEDLPILPRGPLAAFLLVQNVGYLVAFTAGGQTLGKMMAGLRVVPMRSEARLDLGRAALRTLVWTALAAPAGLGFLTALFSRDRRGLHDQCAGTRVVRAA